MKLEDAKELATLIGRLDHVCRWLDNLQSDLGSTWTLSDQGGAVVARLEPSDAQIARLGAIGALIQRRHELEGRLGELGVELPGATVQLTPQAVLDSELRKNWREVAAKANGG